MSVRLSVDDAWDAIGAAHTGILPTLRADGTPVSLPVWFVAFDRTICPGAPEGTKELQRVERDPRAGFLVESGEGWVELRAVHVNGFVERVEDEPTMRRIDEALDAKYAAFRTPSTSMASATQAHYAGRAFLRLVPDDHRVLSWDNRRIQLEEPT